MRFAVWAPNAGRIDLVLRDDRVRMEGPDERGWWTIDAAASDGDRYGFSLDGGDVRPDPRSPHQPDGVHGSSAVVDHDAYEWGDAKFHPGELRDAVIYELHVGTFTPGGTFSDVADRLDHLVSLGVTAVELMPVAEAPGARGWGYDGVDLYAPHHAYGNPGELKALVDACHAKGLAVILDVVYNHLGPDGNYLGEFGPYFTDRYNTPWGAAINFDDVHSDEVRRFFIDNALMWLRDYHFDGLRLDAVHAMFDRSAVHFLEQLETEVEELERETQRELWVIAESDLNDPRLVHRRERGGFNLDAQWSDDFHHALHAYLTGERSGYYADFGWLRDIAHALRHGYVYDGRYSAFRGRTHGRSTEGLEPYRFLGYLQDHDQVGNRAKGERSSASMSADLLKVAAALVLTSPFVPMLFQGEEWGAGTPFLYFTDHEPALGRAVDAGRKREFAGFGWAPEDVPDPQAIETFEASKLDWSELDDPVHADHLQWHRDLIAFRRENPDLSRLPLVETKVTFYEDGRWFWFGRGRVTVAANLGPEPAEVVWLDHDPGGLRLCSSKEPERHRDYALLDPESVAIFTS